MFYERERFENYNIIIRFLMAPIDILRLTYKTIRYAFMRDYDFRLIQIKRINPKLYDLVK
jgi:hypothetical protein